jgi:hypothetical protein
MFDGIVQVLGKNGCDFSGSYTLPGTGNNDVGWASVETLDFHLTDASSLAIDRVATCSTTDDIDGQMRPAAGGGCDFGADEHYSP